MAAPHGSWICGMLTNAITKPYTTLVWFCPGWAFQYQNGGKLGMGNGSSHITGMYLGMNTDISYINCCILVLYMYTIYTGTGPSIHRRLQHCCWSKAFRRSKEGLWQGKYLLVHKQEMCTLCSAATPSPLTRLRGKKVKVHEAFLSDIAHSFEKKCLSHSCDTLGRELFPHVQFA